MTVSFFRVGFGFKFGYVVFKSASGMRNALKVMDLSTPRVACNANNITSVGIVKWKEEYNNSIIKGNEGFFQSGRKNKFIK